MDERLDMPTVENENMMVEYSVKKDSFSHSFGVQKTTSTEIENIKAYVPALNEWIDVTHMSLFLDVAQKLVDEKGDL